MLHTYWLRLRGLQRNARLFLWSNVLINVAAAAIGLLYTIFLTDLGFTTGFLSDLLIIGIAGAGLGLIPAIIIANRFSARRLLIGSNLIGGVAAGAQLVVPQAAVLLVTTFFVGASASIYIVLTPPLLAATSTEAERAHLFSINATLGLLTGVVGSLIGGFLPRLMALPAVLHFPLVVAVGPLLVHGKTLPLQLALLAVGALSIACLWPLYLMDDAVVRLNPPPAPGAPAPPGIGQTVRAWLGRWREVPHLARSAGQWRATPFAIYETVLGFGAGLFLAYINLFFVKHLGLGTATYSVISSASTIILAAATLGAPIIAERFGSVRGPVVAQLCSVPLLVLLGFTHNIPLIVGCYLLRGTLMNLGQPALQSFVMGILPPGERGAASSIFNVGFQVTSAAGGVLSGYLLDRGNYALTFSLAGLCYVSAMLVLVPWFGREAALLHHESPATETPAVASHS